MDQVQKERYEVVTTMPNGRLRRGVRHRCGSCWTSVTAQDSFCRGCGTFFDMLVKK